VLISVITAVADGVMCSGGCYVITMSHGSVITALKEFVAVVVCCVHTFSVELLLLLGGG